MDIRIADQNDFDVIRHITQNTITEIYPHYYPQGVVEFFLSLHNDTAIKNDIDKNRVYLDALATNKPAQHLYESLGFAYRGKRNLYAENTGWTDFLYYEFEEI